MEGRIEHKFAIQLKPDMTANISIWSGLSASQGSFSEVRKLFYRCHQFARSLRRDFNRRGFEGQVDWSWLRVEHFRIL
ncbi:unnamed protein product [Trifolium pratense]|uniref:Uncharacterized protein n=1 Tax=Trifolium pratense TaxID=57577 RepID=A0ACB0M4K7_TRIPR|nr:unnamed protein product [Trifolium pratense]